MDEKIPIEVGMSIIKQSVVKYVSALCMQYEVPTALAIQILQEIVYENKLNAMNLALSQMQTESKPPQEFDISANELMDSLQTDA